jgi:peptidoglycan hydrolase-like protein with peptidoglycan-binding domain
VPYPVVPETIVVHLGKPDQPAENVTVSFADYIKNVASSEIYPTWPESAIRANLLAQISYTLNRIYTEHYRSRGYDFDVTNSTQYDQAYVPGRDVFENISRLTDDLFNNYIVRRGNLEPLFAQFCDGVRVQCNGLSQWGSVALAEDGLVPYQILQNYYGENIDLVFNAPVGGNIPSYPGVALRRGDSGEDIRIIKRELNRIGKNYPSIPAITEQNVTFDLQTEDAVREFQRIFNLMPDGIVGKSTWYKLKEIYNGVKRLSELTSEGLTLSEAQRKYPRSLQFGDSGDSVRVIQYFLAFLGYFIPELPQIAITGQFDENTRDAVLTFQNRYGLTVDGIVGRSTWNRMQEVYRGVVGDLPAQYRSFVEDIFPGSSLALNETGPNVTHIQTYLKEIAKTDPAIPPVEVTGVYDTATQAAVRELQKQLGYEPSGVVGPLIWSAIVTRGRGL